MQQHPQKKYELRIVGHFTDVTHHQLCSLLNILNRQTGTLWKLRGKSVKEYYGGLCQVFESSNVPATDSTRLPESVLAKGRSRAFFLYYQYLLKGER